MPLPSLRAAACAALLVAAGAPALAETLSRVEEDVPGRANANRHRLHLQDPARGALLSASCRVGETDALGAALVLGEGRRWSGPQEVVAARGDGAPRTITFTPTDGVLTLAGPGTAEILGWMLSGGSVSFRHPDGPTITFALRGARADIARFRRLCAF